MKREDIDLNKVSGLGLATGQDIGASDASQIGDDICSLLDQVFDLIFTSSKQVLGNINSLGVRYGRSFDSPDHMLVLFPGEVYGFESWNSKPNRNLWQYHKSSKSISCNGRTVTDDSANKFVEFVRNGLMAINDEQVVFSKNITKNEIKRVV